MAKKLLKPERLQALIAELIDCQEGDEPVGIDDLEDSMVELGDAVAREYARQQLARQMEQPPALPPCPTCQHPGEPAGHRHREILTRRGKVPIREAKFRCRKCRRHFFPSDRIAGA